MRRVIGLIFVVVALAAGIATSARAADGDAITDAAKAGKDYTIQGEYEGTAGDAKIGAQIIALGDDKFRAVFYVGGLPGNGWTRSDKKIETESKLDGDEVKFTHEGKSAVLKDGKLTLIHENGEKVATIDKVERKSSTLGAKAPDGAVVLFGEKGDESKWNKGRLTEDGNLAVGSDTKDKFGDCTLHIEFRTPYQPKARGQGRGNSGVYLNSMYELQVLDSFGLSGENNECGGFYQIRQPDVNMCYPPLAWQTYDIDFTAAKYEDGKKTKSARVTVKHNGVVIHDNIELPRGTPGRIGEGAGPAPLFFQDHGNPVAYRNIWVVKK